LRINLSLQKYRLGEDRLGEDRLGEDRLGEDRLGEERLGEERLGEDGLGEGKGFFLLLSVSLSPKVITLSSFHCIII
jgi:hypothetical protein